jgi:hypothetical protein
MLFDAHTRSFAALGGGAPGHLRQHEDGRGQGQEGQRPRVNARFAVMCAHYLFDPDFCNVASGWEKGRWRRTCKTAAVASGWTRAAALWQLRGTQRLAGRALPGAVARAAPPPAQAFSVAEMLELERSHLMPMPAAFRRLCREPGAVSSTCLVTVARNRYSVPCEWAGNGQHASVSGAIVVVADDALVASTSAC